MSRSKVPDASDTDGRGAVGRRGDGNVALLNPDRVSGWFTTDPVAELKRRLAYSYPVLTFVWVPGVATTFNVWLAPLAPDSVQIPLNTH